MVICTVCSTHITLTSTTSYRTLNHISLREWLNTLYHLTRISKKYSSAKIKNTCSPYKILSSTTVYGYFLNVTKEVRQLHVLLTHITHIRWSLLFIGNFMTRMIQYLTGAVNIEFHHFLHAPFCAGLRCAMDTCIIEFHRRLSIKFNYCLRDIFLRERRVKYDVYDDRTKHWVVLLAFVISLFMNSFFYEVEEAWWICELLSLATGQRRVSSLFTRSFFRRERLKQKAAKF